MTKGTVDSPAANFPICKILRKHGTRTVHLVAPQLWAWGRGRIGKLRRRTDLVLCMLPFEEQWFNDRNIPARFVGHPAMSRPLDEDELIPVGVVPDDRIAEALAYMHSHVQAEGLRRHMVAVEAAMGAYAAPKR